MGRRALDVGDPPAETSALSWNSRVRSDMCLVLGSLNWYVYIYIYIFVLERCLDPAVTRGLNLHRSQAIFVLKFDLLGAACKKVWGTECFWFGWLGLCSDFSFFELLSVAAAPRSSSSPGAVLARGAHSCVSWTLLCASLSGQLTGFLQDSFTSFQSWALQG